jgi:hypothetical protein
MLKMIDLLPALWTHGFTRVFHIYGFDASPSPPFLSFERVNWNYPTVAQKRPSCGVKTCRGTYIGELLSWSECSPLDSRCMVGNPDLGHMVV